MKYKLMLTLTVQTICPNYIGVKNKSILRKGYEAVS